MGDQKHETEHAVRKTADVSHAPTEGHNPAKPEQVDKLLASNAIANTSWSINYGTIGSQVGKPVAARTPQSSLYVQDLKIAPDGEPGKANPTPHHFHGVTLASTGAAHVGTYAHPKARAGIASAAISFGSKPKFDFTITSKPSDFKLAQRQHAAVAKQLAAELDEFVDEVEAQAVLDRVIAANFGTDEVEAVIKRQDHQLGSPVNTSDLKYSPVQSDRSFRLRVDVPTVVKDKSLSWGTTGGGETIKGKETTEGASNTVDTTTTATVEMQQRHAIETSLKSGLRGLTKNFVNNGLASEITTFHESGSESVNGSTTKLSGSIGGEIDVMPNIPLLGPLVKRLLNPKLKVNLAPDFSGMFSLTGTKKDTSAGKQGFQHSNGVEVVQESEVESLAKTLQANELRTKIETAVKVSVAKTTGERESGSNKKTSTTSTSATVGTVHVVSTSVQANLVEE